MVIGAPPDEAGACQVMVAFVGSVGEATPTTLVGLPGTEADVGGGTAAGGDGPGDGDNDGGGSTAGEGTGDEGGGVGELFTIGGEFVAADGL